MRKYKKYIEFIFIFVLCIIISACSRTKDFDAKGYVQSCMDAIYHGDYKSYATFLEISEDVARKQLEESFEESITAQFEGSDSITGEGIATYTEKMQEVKKLAKYEVLEAAETDDGNYTVSIQIEPSDVMQTLEASAAEISGEMIAQGKKESDPGMLETVLCESIQMSIDKNTYGNPSTVEVLVTANDSGIYSLSETELSKLEIALFPGE